MATLDGYSPYPFGMTAAQVIAALRKAYVLDTTLGDYALIIKSDTSPIYDNVSTTGMFWYNTSTDKLYRAIKDSSITKVLWFEV